METIIIAAVGGLLGGSAVAALINQIGESLRERARRKAKADDGESADIKEIKRALKYVMLDRIRYLGQEYIRDGEIDFDDRRILNEMHQSYHNGLGGNGDLDTLMTQVNSLPLKVR